MIRQHGTSAEEVIALYHDWRSIEHSPEEQVMLEFAEKLTYAPWSVEESDLNKLRDAGFSEENIVDIVLVAAYRNFINRVHIALGLSPESMRERMPGVVDAILEETAAKRQR